MTDFVDFHVHPPVAEFLNGPLAPHLDALRVLLTDEFPVWDVDSIAEYYRRRSGRAVLLGWDAESATSRRPFSGADVAALVATAPDVFVGFGGVDPAKGARAVADIHTVARLGLPGIAVHPVAQGFDPADRSGFAVWETAAEHDLVCLFHTGFTRLGAGVPGGDGLRLDRGRPIRVDAIAAAFPRLRIVLSHTGDVWLDEAIAIARQKRNVWLCIAGERPHAGVADPLERIALTLTDRCLFGSDWMFASLDDWLAEWRDLGLPPGVLRAVLRDNAWELLGLDGGD